MTENSTSQATLEAVARRLGVRQKLLTGLLTAHRIQPDPSDANLYALTDIIRLLESLTDIEQGRLQTAQRTLPNAEALYRDKFAILAPYAPQGKMTAQTPAQPLLEPIRDARERLSTLEISKLLRISTRRAKELTNRLQIDYTTQRGSGQRMWRGDQLRARLNNPAHEKVVQQWQLEFAAAAHTKTEKFSSAPQFRASTRDKGEKNDLARELREQLEARVTVEVRERAAAPTTAHLYVGPTNSGKTYTALENLFSEYTAAATGTFVYAGPLRMLAFEVYQKMVDRFGADQVGFLTGEEQINPTARLLACTVEMAPDEGASLVLDETHWIADHARGQHWTNLLLGARYDSYHILTAAEAVDMVRQLVDDAETLTTEIFTRKTPLIFAGGMKIADVPARSAVICFSRKSVYATANLLEKSGKKVGVLYGALPLPVRKRQIERYIQGMYDIMVTTDVIGHGINLPIDNVIFAQSEKYDGIDHRSLHTWEIAQIAGRAGRYGLSKEGNVYYLQGRGWFTRDAGLLREGTLAGAGLIPTDLRIDTAVVTPQLRDLHITHPEEILPALEVWQVKAKQLLAERDIAPSNLLDKIALLQAVAEPRALPLTPTRDRSDWEVSLDEVWQLISGPYSSEGQTVQKIFTWLADPKRATSTMLSKHLQQLMRPMEGQVHATGNQSGDQVSILEESVRGVGELKMAHIMFAPLGDLLLSELLEAEDRLNEAITNTLASLIQAGKYGTCKECGAPTTPWFVYCEDCFHRQKFSFAF